MMELTPREIVAELDRHIVGQADAKRAVAVAVRNRWRRARLAPDIRDEVLPKNILMIGPTGVGKTEIARRLAALVRAPFVKVEASKFTEVGYVGRDVESIVRDLMEAGISLARAEALEGVRDRAREIAEEAVLDALLPGAPEGDDGDDERARRLRTREKLRGLLHSGQLGDREVEIRVAERAGRGGEVFGQQGFEQTGIDLQAFMERMMPRRQQSRRVSVREALELKAAEAAEELIDRDRVAEDARARVESSGVVFIDEIDKITADYGHSSGPDVSREGVQRDLLPIVEGSAVPTRHGVVKTDHVLFIAAGAFHVARPSDLIPELQGRFPIRVSLAELGREDFVRILTEPENALTLQYRALLGADGVEVTFTPDGVDQIAAIAMRVNRRDQNIGARRLFTLMEKVLEEVSFLAPDPDLRELVVDSAFVLKRVESIAGDEDLSRAIL
ncbi:MAG: ATP-dependent protease ATPase subunit HslU [Planctomycetes bacterium]|nr:ATP-dependent protease ATPase subunit HslU [Planctomycetota bacterium]